MAVTKEVVFRARTEGFEKAKSGITGMSAGLKTMAGQLLGVASAYIVVSKSIQFMSSTYQSAMKQMQALNLVTNAIKQTGGAADVSTVQLNRMAGKLQDISNYGDEDILRNVSAILLTFVNIRGQIFEQAQKAAIDMATVMGTDLKSAAVQLGKALNDPTQGLTALRRVGVSFNKEQQETIKSMYELGKVSEAQTLILKELEKEFGNAAEAMADPAIQLINKWDDFKETLGASVLPAVKSFVDGAKPLLDTLITLNTDYSTTFDVLKLQWATLSTEARKSSLDIIKSDLDAKKMLLEGGGGFWQTVLVNIQNVTEATGDYLSLVGKFWSEIAKNKGNLIKVDWQGIKSKGKDLGTTRTTEELDKLQKQYDKLFPMYAKLNDETIKNTGANTGNAAAIEAANKALLERISIFNQYNQSYASLVQRLSPDSYESASIKLKALEEDIYAVIEAYRSVNPSDAVGLERLTDRLMTAREQTEEYKRVYGKTLDELIGKASEFSLKDEALKIDLTFEIQDPKDMLSKELDFYSQSEAFAKQSAEIKRQLLDIQKGEYGQYIDDKIALDIWYNEQLNKINEEMLSKELDFYSQSEAFAKRSAEIKRELLAIEYGEYDKFITDKDALNQWFREQTDKINEEMLLSTSESYKMMQDFGEGLMDSMQYQLQFALQTMIMSTDSAADKMKSIMNSLVSAIVAEFTSLVSAIVAEFTKLAALAVFKWLVGAPRASGGQVWQGAANQVMYDPSTWGRAQGGQVLKAATGGQLRGWGGYTQDNIPVWASNGEYIVNAKSSQKYLGMLEAINNDRMNSQVPVININGLIAAINRVEKAVVEKPVPSLAIGDIEISKVVQSGNNKRAVLGIE